MDSWIEDLRRDLRLAEQREEKRFQRVRSEAVFGRVLARLREDRQRLSWRWLFARGAALLRSRAIRMLMP